MEDVVGLFHVSLSVSALTPPLSANLTQENSIGALQIHPYFIWRLTTLAGSSLDWDPVLVQKGVAMRKRGKTGAGAMGKWREGSRKAGGNAAWEESVCVCVYMQAYVRRRREGEERKGHGEGE